MPEHRKMSIEWAKPVANEALSLQHCNALRGGRSMEFKNIFFT